MKTITRFSSISSIVTIAVLASISLFMYASVAHAVNPCAISDAACVGAATSTLSGSSPVTAVQGADTNAATKAQGIVDAALPSSGVTVTVASSLNANVAADGTITYGASAVTGNVTFHVVKNAASADQTVSVVVPTTTPDYVAIFGAIKSTLHGQGIETNIDSCAGTPVACSGLYFEKTGYGRVTFTASLDLTDSATNTFLQNLGSKMDAAAGSMKFDATTATQLKNAGAQIAIYGLDALGYTSQPNIVVKNDSGVVIDPSDAVNYPALTGIVYAAGGPNGGTLTFTASHFTQFDVDNNVYVSPAGNDTHAGTSTSPVKTIKHAVAIAPIGGTVHVAAGTYNEFVTISKSLTLSGAEAGVDARTRATTTESVIDGSGLAGVIWVNGNGITVKIDGFTLQSDSAISVSNNGYGAAITTVQSSGLTGLNVSNNIIQHASIGIAPQGSTSTIQYNLIQNMDISGPAAGTGIYTDFGLSNSTIDNNTFVNNPNESININTSGGNNTLSNNVMDSGIYLHAQPNSRVTGNTVTNSPGGGITLGGNQNGITVTNNHVNGVASGYAAFRLRDDAGGANSAVTATGNTFAGAAGYGIRVADGALSDELIAHNNILTSDTLGGLVNNNAVNILGERNYWGGSNGPATSTNPAGTGSKIDGTGPVAYSPWWTDSAMTTLQYTTTTSGGQASTTVVLATTMTGTSTQSGGVAVTSEMPAGTVVTGDSSWGGTISPPTATTITLTISGYTTSVSSAIAIGSNDSDLTFDHAVRLTFAGQTGQRVGWYNHAGTFTEITSTCATNDQVTGDALPAGGSCKFDTGVDLVVWTKHFSTFVTYTQTAVPPSGGGGGGGGGGIATGPLSVGYINTNPTAGAVGSNVGIGSGVGAGTGTGFGGQVLGASTFNFSSNLGYGTRGAIVNALHQRLIDAGYLKIAAPTGWFGPMTFTAVKKYQAAHQIPATGFVGPLTRAALNAQV